MVSTGFNRLELAHRTHASGVMAVDKHRQVDFRLQRPHQISSGVRGEQTGHILDRDRVDAHGLHGLGLFHKRLNGVHGAGGVRDGTLCVLTGGLHRLNGHAQVTHVVHRIKDAEHVDTIDGGFGHKGAHHVITVVAITEQVLSTQEHLQAGVRQTGLEFAQALPGIFLEEAHAGIEGRAAPDLQRPVTDLIKLGADRQHVIQAHACSDDRLVGIAQDGIGDGDLLVHGLIPSPTGRRGQRWRWQWRWPGATGCA